MTTSLQLLANRTALVTGAGGGVGRGIALALAAAGANVAIAVRRAATGDETVRLIEKEGGRAISVEADVARHADVERAVVAAAQRFGGLDIMVHNASSGLSGLPAALEEITDESWDAQAAVALDGAFHCAQAALPYLKRSKQARYILLGSCFGLHGAAMNPVYASLKGGYRGFVKALAREWGPFNITVNAVNPAAETEAAAAYFAQVPELKAAYVKNFALGRMGLPREDIGGIVVALCSSHCGYLTAQSVQADGGLYTVT